MGNHRTFAVVYRSVIVLFFVSLAMLMYGIFWEYSTDRYLEGFAEGIVPRQGSPQQDAETLLEWFSRASERLDNSPNVPNSRNPLVILHYSRLLAVCGTSVNAFVNLSHASGLKTRRLLLLDRSGGTMHVVSELQIDNRWIIVDPVYRAFFKDASGRLLTKEELRDSRVFRDAISRIRGYPPEYVFARTTHLHLEHIPLVGKLSRRLLDRIFPKWDDTLDWGYFPEHPSLGFMMKSLALLISSLAAACVLDWYGRNRLGLESQVRRRVGEARRLLFSRRIAGL